MNSIARAAARGCGTPFECNGLHTADKSYLDYQTASSAPQVSNEWIDFSVYQLCPSLPQQSIQAVWARVIGTSCYTTVEIGDIVLVYDTRGCWFNVPIELLSTFSGRADLTAGHNEQVLFCAEYRDLGECYWKVTGLCCYEESY